MERGQNGGMRLSRRDVLRSGVAGAGILMLPDALTPTSVASASAPAAADAVSHGQWFAGDTHVHCDQLL